MDEPNGYLIDATKHLELEGTHLVLEDVSFRGKEPARKGLKRFSEHIRERYTELSEPRETPLPPYSRESGYLRRAAYAFTRFVEDEGGLRALSKFVEAQNLGWTSKRGPTVDENPFHWILAAVFPDNMLKKVKGDEAPMFPQERNHMARQLLYAERHNVPTEYLIGFLYQSGKPSEIARKLREDLREPWADAAKLAGARKRRKKRTFVK